MSPIQRFCRPGSIYIERQEDRWNGEGFIAWKPHISKCFTDRKALLRFIAWPAKTPTGDEIREWLKGFDAVVDHELPTHDPQTALPLSDDPLNVIASHEPSQSLCLHPLPQAQVDAHPGLQGPSSAGR